MRAPEFRPAELLDALDRVNAVLVAKAFPAMSPWWRRELERFVRAMADGRRQLVLRVGRRGGKSSSLCRLAVVWALFGSWSVPPGDVAVVAIISVSLAEARERFRTIAAILTALGVPFDRRGDDLELRDRPVVFRCFACSTSAPVGFTGIAVIADEVARWESRDAMTNPARHVIGTVRPTLATQPFGFTVLSSSPWTLDDYHAEQFDRGDTADQVVACAPSWVANPTITEGATRRLEPDDRTWRREYAAIPSPTSSAPFFPEDALERSRDVGRVGPLRHVEGRRYRIGLDQAFMRDRFGLAVVSSELADADPLTGVRAGRVTVVHQAEAWAAQGNVVASLRRVRDACVRFDTSTVAIDQHGGAPMKELLRQLGVFAEIINWTGGDGEGSKLARYRAVRDAMIAGALRLPDSPELLGELRTIQTELSPSGVERIVVQRTRAGHGDAATALVLAASEALARGPLLPEARMTNWEKRERAENEARLRALFW